MARLGGAAAAVAEDLEAGGRRPGGRGVVVLETCCGIGVEGGMTREEAERSAALLKAVADPVRLRLLSAIRATEAGEACVCDLTELVGLAQPTVSHHLKVLVEAGLVERERRGSWAWFRLLPARLDDARAILR